MNVMLPKVRMLDAGYHFLRPIGEFNLMHNSIMLQALREQMYSLRYATVRREMKV